MYEPGDIPLAVDVDPLLKLTYIAHFYDGILVRVDIALDTLTSRVDRRTSDWTFRGFRVI